MTARPSHARPVRLAAAVAVGAGVVLAPAASAVEASRPAPSVPSASQQVPGVDYTDFSDRGERREFAELPESWTTDWYIATRDRDAFADPTLSFWESQWDTPQAVYEVVDAPEHGTFAEVVNEDTRTWGFGYRPVEGFTGTDSLTLEWTHDGVTKTERIVIHVGDDTRPTGQWRADGIDWSTAKNAVGVELAGAEDAAPALPTEPAAEDEGHHDVPEKVETGDAAQWWLAGLAAVGAGALVTVRRTFAIK